MSHTTFSHIGLISDILGALLLFAYGLPSKQIDTRGKALITDKLEDDDLVEANKINRRIAIGSKAGLILLILGFLFQFIGVTK